MDWSTSTEAEAAEAARFAVAQASGARAWWAQADDAANLAIQVSEDVADNAPEFWGALQTAWDEAGLGFPGGVKPGGWDKLAGVWAQAAVASGSALRAEDEQSIRAIVSGGLVGSYEDAAEVVATSSGIVVKATEFINKHPGWAAGLVGAGVVVYKTMPLIIARLVLR